MMGFRQQRCRSLDGSDDDDYNTDFFGKLDLYDDYNTDFFGVLKPPGMVLTKSAKRAIPIFENFWAEQMNIALVHDNIKNKAFVAIHVMPMISSVIVIVGVYILRSAFLGFGFWYSIVHCLGGVSYLCWLRKQQHQLEKRQVEIAELVLEKRKKLPMVAADNPKADQDASNQIDFFCDRTTKSLPLDGSMLNRLIYFTALNGSFLSIWIGLFYYGSASIAHTLTIIFVVAMNVIVWICVGLSCYYCWRKSSSRRKSPVECPPV